MDKRIKIICCDCGEEYSLFRTLNLKENPHFITQCPFCHVECEVDLRTHLNQADGIFKSVAPDNAGLETIDFNRPFISKPKNES